MSENKISPKITTWSVTPSDNKVPSEKLVYNSLTGFTGNNNYIKNQFVSGQTADFNIIGKGKIVKTFSTSSGIIESGLEVNATESVGHASEQLKGVAGTITISGSNSPLVGVAGDFRAYATTNIQNLAGSTSRTYVSGSATVSGTLNASLNLADLTTSANVPWAIANSNYVYLKGTGDVQYLRGIYTDLFINNASANVTDSATIYNGHLNNNSGATIALAEGIFVKINNVNGTITDGRAVHADLGNAGTVNSFKGVSIGEWTNTGTVNNSYGIHIDSTIDVGTTKYAIYSESLSDSYFKGKISHAVGVLSGDSATLGQLNSSFLTAGSVGIGAVKYNGTTKTAGQFYGGTTTPTSSTRLNYDGYFYPTFLNLVGSDDTSNAATHYFVETGTDGYVRPKTLSTVKAELVVASEVLTKIKTVDGIGSALDAEYLGGNLYSTIKKSINTVNNNLGTPSVEEMALIHGQFTNKLRFIPAFTQEQSTDGITWTGSTRLTTDQLKDIMIGEGQWNGGNVIPAPVSGVTGGAYRLTWDATQTGYVFLNSLYVYCSTNGNTVKFIIERMHNTTGWETVTSGSTSNWPGHVYIPHTSTPFSTSASQYGKIRISFQITTAGYANAFTIYGIEWFGGYPAGRRNVESYDRDRNVTFPNRVISTNGFRIGANDINTAGTLTNVAYKGTLGTGYIPHYDGADLESSPLYRMNSGAVTIGGTTIYTSSGSYPAYWSNSTQVSAGYAGIGGAQFTNDIYPTGLIFVKSRGTTIGTHGAVVSGDRLGQSFFEGSDGTNFKRSAQELIEVDGTVSTNIVPSRFTWYTTNSGGTMTEKMRLTGAGNVGIGTAAPVSKLHVVDTIADSNVLGMVRILNPNASTAGRLTSMFIGKSVANGGSGEIGYLSDTATPTNGVLTLNNWGDSQLTQSLAVKKGGNVGIGTTTPTAQLQVGISPTSIALTAPSKLKIVGTYNTTDDYITLVKDRETGIKFMIAAGIKLDSHTAGLQPSSRLSFNLKSTSDNTDVANITVMSLLDNGNVGIGSTNPTTKLDVNGSIRGTTAKFTNLNNGYIPYHISDSSGLTDSSIIYSGGSVFVGMAANNAYLDAQLVTPMMFTTNTSFPEEPNEVINYSQLGAVLNTSAPMVVSTTVITVGVDKMYTTLAAAWNWAIARSKTFKSTIVISIDAGTFTLNAADAPSRSVGDTSIVFTGAGITSTIINTDTYFFFYNSRLYVENLTMNGTNGSYGMISIYSGYVSFTDVKITSTYRPLILESSIGYSYGVSEYVGNDCVIRLQSSSHFGLAGATTISHATLGSRAFVIYDDCTVVQYSSLTVTNFTNFMDGGGTYNQNNNYLTLTGVTNVVINLDERGASLFLNSNKLTLNTANWSTNTAITGYGTYRNGLKIIDTYNTTTNNDKAIFGKVTYTELGDDLVSRKSISGTTVVNWNDGGVFTKNLTGNTTLTFSNLKLNKRITLLIYGNYTLTLPTYCNIISGTYSGNSSNNSVKNYIQCHCTDSSNGTEEVWVTINQKIIYFPITLPTSATTEQVLDYSNTGLTVIQTDAIINQLYYDGFCTDCIIDLSENSIPTAVSAIALAGLREVTGMNNTVIVDG